MAVTRLELLGSGAARASGGRPWGRKGAAALGWERGRDRGSMRTGGSPGTRRGGRRRRRRTEVGWRRRPGAAHGGPRRQRPGVRESPSEWSKRVEGGEEVLTEEGIGGGVAGEDGAVETAVAAGTGEEPVCAAPR